MRPYISSDCVAEPPDPVPHSMAVDTLAHTVCMQAHCKWNVQPSFQGALLKLRYLVNLD